MFGAETVGVKPDIVTLAKGIAGGFPLAAVLGKSEIMDSIHEAGIGSTFWSLACVLCCSIRCIRCI